MKRDTQISPANRFLRLFVNIKKREVETLFVSTSAYVEHRARAKRRLEEAIG